MHNFFSGLGSLATEKYVRDGSHTAPNQREKRKHEEETFCWLGYWIVDG